MFRRNKKPSWAYIVVDYVYMKSAPHVTTRVIDSVYTNLDDAKRKCAELKNENGPLIFHKDVVVVQKPLF